MEAARGDMAAIDGPVREQLPDTRANRALFPKVTSEADFQAEALRTKAYFADSRSLVFQGDATEVLDQIADAGVRVDTIVTSPPFYGQRDYGVDGQIGLEEHPQEFIDRLLAVFTRCADVLNETGSMWVNLGDTYWAGKGQHRSNESKQGARRFGLRPQDSKGDGKWARPKQLLLIPHRFAIAMQDAGWIVRNDNVWVKPNPIPDQVRDRCSISHEYVFHFVRERWYYFNRGAVGRPTQAGSVLPPLDTWLVPPSRNGRGHKAAFSEELVRLPILATTPPDGIVLDPFVGSGTSMVVAKRHGFRSVGIDIKAEFCELSAQALKDVDREPRQLALVNAEVP